MKIEFYEEFPNKSNLKKLKDLKFPTKIFLAAKSIEEFKRHESIARKYKKDLEVAYWPIVKNSYWISPFSNHKDLLILFRELNTIKNPLLIDLELPLAKRWKMYFKNIFDFRKNKRLIQSFLEQNKNRITTAEYAHVFSKMRKILGLSYKINHEKSIMYYTSVRSEKLNKKIRENLKQIKNKSNYSISLGTISIGILGNEPILSPQNFEKDLNFANKIGFKKIIIFRLEGLNKKYLKVINKFLKK